MIPNECANKIMSFGGDKEIRLSFLSMFNHMAEEGDKGNVPASTMILQLYDNDSNLQPGDWAPEIHFVLRKVDRVKTPEEIETERKFNESVRAAYEAGEPPAAHLPEKVDKSGAEEGSA